VYVQATVETMLAAGLMGSDQHVIYVAVNTMNVTTRLQLYRSGGKHIGWFHLGYLARDAGIARMATRSKA
jgi:hypothetical protein